MDVKEQIFISVDPRVRSLLEILKVLMSRFQVCSKNDV